jgi:ketosteroid isomerase-like protein
MLTAYIAALNANMPPHLNAAAIANLFTEDGIQQNVMSDALPGTEDPQKGRAALQKFFASFDQHFADWTHVETRRTVQGHHAVWEGIAQGTHKETGKPLRIPIVFSMEFDAQGKVKEALVYVNTGMVAKQLQ